MMDAKTYTKWLRSSITQELVTKAQAALMNRCHELPVTDQWSCAAKALLREGGEIVLNFLVSQRTVEAEERLQRLEVEPDFGADEIRARELNPSLDN
jgi:hypothetical protein